MKKIEFSYWGEYNQNKEKYFVAECVDADKYESYGVRNGFRQKKITSR